MALVSSGYRSDIFTSSSPALQPAEDEGQCSCAEAPVLDEPPTAAMALAAPKILPGLVLLQGWELWVH